MNYPANSKTVKLTRSIIKDGVEVEELHLREPTVFDKLNYEKQKGSALEKEINMIASLCGVEPSDLHALPAYDYSQLGKALNEFFLLAPEERSKSS